MNNILSIIHISNKKKLSITQMLMHVTSITKKTIGNFNLFLFLYEWLFVQYKALFV